MFRRTAAALLIMCLLLACACAEQMTEECVFDGYAVKYPAELRISQNEQGIFLVDGDDFFQINTALFPKEVNWTASQMLADGAIAALQESNGDGLVYTSDGEVVTLGGREYVYLTALRGDRHFYQYIGLTGRTLLVFTVRGDQMNALAPEIIASLREADKVQKQGKQYTGDQTDERVTRDNGQGEQEPAGFRDKPVTIGYAAFEQGFREVYAELIGIDDPARIKAGPCWFSDGRYVRVISVGHMVTRIYTAGPSPMDPVLGLYITAPGLRLSRDEQETGIAVNLIAAFEAIGSMRSETLDRFVTLLNGIPETQGDGPFWMENGFEVRVGRRPAESWCIISRQGETPAVTAPGYAEDCRADGLPGFDRPALTAEKFIGRFLKMRYMLTLTAQEQAEPVREGDVLVYPLGKDGRLLMHLKDGSEEAPVDRVSVRCPKEDADDMVEYCLSAFWATTDLTDEESLYLLYLFDNADPMWEQFTPMKPVVLAEGAVLQVYEEDGTLCAELYGTGT